MARVKISEYRAKKILLGKEYKGVSVREGETEKLPSGKLVAPQGHFHFSNAEYREEKLVAKVDQGVKKRMKQGLVAVNVSAAEVPKHLAAWKKKGFSQFLVEPLFPHDAKDEQYLSFERVREGIRVLHARDGGIEIESNPEAVATYLIRSLSDVADIAQRSGIPENVLAKLVGAFDEHFFAFLELNPLVVRGEEAVPLDAAALVDSAGAFFTDAWREDDIIVSGAKHAAEREVEKLAATTPAQLSLKILNPNGSLFFLLSGGGGSIVIADEAQLEGMGDSIANYGEYSGGPSREETHLYAREVIQLLLDSKAKKKALVIAGGVANFTDVKKTFSGIIDALSEKVEPLRKQGVKVFIRRGGPNEATGLALMREFLKEERLLGAVHGSDQVITKAVEDAIHFIKT